MHLFDADDTLNKYETVSEIIDAYYEVRLQLYQTRKDNMIAELERELSLLSNKARYIMENLEGTIDLRKKKKDHIIVLLKEKEYDILDEDMDYKYLLKMPMDSVSEENVEKLNAEHDRKMSELDKVRSTTTSAMWLEELAQLLQEYLQYKEERTRESNGTANETASGVVAKKHKKIVKKNLVIAK